MSTRAEVRRAAEAIFARFRNAGGKPVEPAVLQPGGPLLDLYGEDIRARAYVTHDPEAGELMLRPDFTVPVVLEHMRHGAEPARYTYLGEVFRQQQPGSGRPNEYLQVGFELFDRGEPARADAELVALFARTLAPLSPRLAMGDIGLLVAAVEGLTTSEVRRRALRRHIWRPARFRRMLDRFDGSLPPPPGREALLAAAREKGVDALIAEAGPFQGLRGPEEIAARIEALVEDAATPPIPAAERRAVEALLALAGPAAEMPARIRALTAELPGLAAAADRLEARLDALAAAGVDPVTIAFEASFGRTTLEYYDGMVFGFMAEGRPELPPIASGGRYDALTRVLGRGREIPAVGGVVRPEVVVALGGLEG